MEDLFFDAIRTAIGSQKVLSHVPSEEEWYTVFQMAERQSLIGIVFASIQSVVRPEEDYYANMDEDLFFSWLRVVGDIQAKNTDLIDLCRRVCGKFRNNGFNGVVLKGQGVARYYDDLAKYRQSGDIDIWLWPDGEWSMSHDARAKRIILYIKSLGSCKEPTYHNIAFDPFADTSVEAHYTPSWFYSPIYNRRLQRWFAQMAPREMRNDFSSVEFNLVYILLHIYRHLFGEGIGLRQVIDYYFVLIHSEPNQRKMAFEQLTYFGARRFTGALMWILHEKLAMKEDLLLCIPDEKEGRFLLSEIMAAGNFGRYDERLDRTKRTTLLGGYMVHVRRNMHFVVHYPSEVLWCPLWKIRHQIWKKRIQK